MLHTKIINQNFFKVFRNIIIAGVVLVVVSLAGIGISCQTQIGEIYNLIQADNQTTQTALTDGGQATDSLDTATTDNAAIDQEQDKAGHHQNDEYFENLTQDPSHNIWVVLAQTTMPSIPVLLFLSLLVILWLVLAVYYWAAVVAWLYKASVQAEMNKALWPILGIFLNLLAVFAFLIIREIPKCRLKQIHA